MTVEEWNTRTHPAPSIAVSDEMIKAALSAYYDIRQNNPMPYMAMHAALTAALGVGRS